MKTKIFVSSNSGLDYLKHSNNISTLPSTIFFKREETYKDFIEMTADMFYNRLRLDPTASPSVIMPKAHYIERLIRNAIDEEYDNFFFIIGNKEFGDVEVAILSALENITDAQYEIFNTNVCCYPHAYLSLEADMLFSNGFTNAEVKEKLNKEIDKISLYFFVPDKPEISYLPKYTNKQAINASGTLYTIGEHGLETINVGTVKPLKYMMDMAIEKIKSYASFLPFILYTDFSSNYNRLIEEELSAEFGKIRAVPKYSVSPAVGTKLGAYTIGVGIIGRDEAEQIDISALNK